MLNRFMLLVSLVMVPTMEAQAEQVDSPDSATVSNEITLSGPYSVRELDPELSKHLQKREKAKDDLTIAGGNWWNDSGPGPYPTTGGQWACSPAMYGITPSGAIMQTLSYTWNDDNLNGWDSQLSVELDIVSGSNVWGANVTAQPSGTLDASGLGIPANSRVYICMKAGNYGVTLYYPPYINYISSNVYYTY